MRRALWLAPLLLAACGGAERPASAPDPNRPVQGTAAAASASPRPPEDCRRVSRRLPGRTLPAARAMAGKARCPLRVVIQDGRRLPLRSDLRPNRINVRVRAGFVARIDGLY